MALVRLLNNKVFEAVPNETLLDAGLRANLVLEHSCKNGRCGTCKSRVLSGETHVLRAEVGLSAAEKAAGWILTCARCAVGDVQLGMEDLGAVRVAAARTLPCRIQSLERLTHDIVAVTLRLPPNQVVDHLSGQYIDVIAAGGLRRSYSVANAPTPNGLIDLHIRRVPNGSLSQYWFEQAKVNDLLRLHGPLGTFFLRDVTGRDLVFLATGTGMAPIKALLESLNELSPELRPASVHVFWGCRYTEDLYWNPTVAFAPSIFTPVLSRADVEWAGWRGHLHEAVLSSGIELSQAEVYACGSPAMIADANRLLGNAGLPEGRFRFDAFVCSAREP